MITFMMMMKSVCRGLFKTKRKKKEEKYVMINYYARRWSQNEKPMDLQTWFLCNFLLFSSSSTSSVVIPLQTFQIWERCNWRRTFKILVQCPISSHVVLLRNHRGCFRVSVVAQPRVLRVVRGELFHLALFLQENCSILQVLVVLGCKCSKDSLIVVATETRGFNTTGHDGISDPVLVHVVIREDVGGLWGECVVSNWVNVVGEIGLVGGVTDCGINLIASVVVFWLDEKLVVVVDGETGEIVALWLWFSWWNWVSVAIRRIHERWKWRIIKKIIANRVYPQKTRNWGFFDICVLVKNPWHHPFVLQYQKEKEKQKTVSFVDKTHKTRTIWIKENNRWKKLAN